MHVVAAHVTNGGGVALGFVLIIIGIAAYWIPTIVGGARKVPNLGSVVIINFFLGWTIVGWVIALAMAARSIPAGYGPAGSPLGPWRRQQPGGPMPPGGLQGWQQQGPQQYPQPGVWDQPSAGAWNQPPPDAAPETGPQPWPQQQSPSGSSVWDQPRQDPWHPPPATASRPPWDQPTRWDRTTPPAEPPPQPED